MDGYDQDKMLKEIEQEIKLHKDDGDASNGLSEEQLEKLQKATHDENMLAEADGKIFRVEEIEYIIADVIKHQDKAFKIKRDIEDLKETVEEDPNFVNHLSQTNFEPHTTASLRYTDEDYIKIQRGVLFYLVKKIGVNLLTGKSIMNVSLPIKIFEPRSFLEKVACDFRYLPHYLLKAYHEIGTIERMKIMTMWICASLHLEPQMHKPFNPILGETFQGVIGDYEIVIEQIWHHPPISAFQLWTDKHENAPIVDGQLAYEASTGLTAITGYKKGVIRIKFQDNDQEIIVHTFPEFEMKGLMKGDRIFDYLKNIKLSDKENDIHADIVLNPDKKGWFKRMFSSTQKTAPDYFDGVIWDSADFSYKDERHNDKETIEKNKQINIFHKFEGNWTKSFKVDDVEVWNSSYKYLTLQYINNPLPSDCRFRTDLIALLNKDWVKAQEQKDVLENIQRNDRKLRKNAEKESKKKDKK